MFRSTITSLSLVAMLAVAATPVCADTWAEPMPRVFASQWGEVGCKILPTGRRLVMGQSAQAEVFKLDPSGKTKIQARFVLVNIPYKLMIVGEGDFIVTIDTYGRLGFEHALTIYSGKGKLIADKALEDLLTADEIKTLPRSASSRSWTKDAEFRADAVAKQMTITLACGIEMRIDLVTGKVTRPQP